MSRYGEDAPKDHPEPLADMVHLTMDIMRATTSVPLPLERALHQSASFSPGLHYSRHERSILVIASIGVYAMQQLLSTINQHIVNQ
jgi:hypothetical protein